MRYRRGKFHRCFRYEINLRGGVEEVPSRNAKPERNQRCNLRCTLVNPRDLNLNLSLTLCVIVLFEIVVSQFEIVVNSL